MEVKADPLIVALLALGLIAFLARRKARPVVTVADRRNINDLVASPAQNALWWSVQAQGDPDMAGPSGGGATPGPASQYLVGPGILSGPALRFPYAWSAPRGGEGLPAGVSHPGGALAVPGPYPPAAGTIAYVQSAVDPESPLLPRNLRLSAPLAVNTWFYNLSTIDPYVAMAAGSGGYIDVERVNRFDIFKSLRPN